MKHIIASIFAAAIVAITFSAASAGTCVTSTPDIYGTVSITCDSTTAAAPATAPASVDPLNRFGIGIGTKNAQPFLTYAAVRAHNLDFDLVGTTGTSERKHESYNQRHYHLGVGLFDNIKGTHLNVGVYSVDRGPGFGKVAYGINATF